MSRKPNETHRNAKKNKILDGARLVFCRKGFLDVTMQDIIDECGISRGGIYLYFTSVDEIFKEVVNRRSKEKFSVIRKSLNDNETFASVLEQYMLLQKERLLHIENSLFRATCEFIFTKTADAAKEFREAQIADLRKSVLAILSLGIQQGVIKNENIHAIADHFIIVIDGLCIFASSEVLTETIIDEQFTLLADMIERIRT